MSIIIQAGHGSSKSKQLMQKLYDRGLSEPLNSYTHQLNPKQIADTVYKVISRNNTSIANSKLVDNVMIDLLLSNLDSENWGWESENNLTALQYWQQIEPDVRFILVFDHPHNLLSQLSSQTMTVGVLDQAMNDWVSYHQNMIDFLEKNQDKVLLIEGAYALDNIKNLSSELKTIAHTLQLKSGWQVPNKPTEVTNSSNSSLNDQSNVVKEHIFSEVLSKYPEVIKLFNILLDKASIKVSDSIYKTKRTNIDSLVGSLNYLKEFDVIDKYREQSADNELLRKQLDNISKDKQKIEGKYLEVKELLDIYKNDIKKLEARKEVVNKPKASKDNALQKENEMLIAQLHHVQEELERSYLKNENKRSDEEAILSPKVLSDNPAYYGAAERIKQDLPYRLGATMIKQSKSVKSLAVLPLSLATEYSKFKKTNNDHSSLPKIEEYHDAHEVEKVKKHLSYKLGKALLDGFNSPKSFLQSPFKIGKEAVEFRKK